MTFFVYMTFTVILSKAKDLFHYFVLPISFFA